MLFALYALLLVTPWALFGLLLAWRRFRVIKASQEELARDAQLVRESESKLSQIIDGCPVPIFVIDANHRVTHWNRACENVTGVSGPEMIGTQQQWRGFYDAPRPVMADIVISAEAEGESALERHYAGKYRRSPLIRGSFEAEDYFPRLGARGRWLYFTAAPLRDGGGNFLGQSKRCRTLPRGAMPTKYCD